MTQTKTCRGGILGRFGNNYWSWLMKVYKAIAAVVGEMSKIGIAKDSKNAMQGYMFRGIDAVYSALSPLLA